MTKPEAEEAEEAERAEGAAGRVVDGGPFDAGRAGTGVGVEDAERAANAERAGRPDDPAGAGTARAGTAGSAGRASGPAPGERSENSGRSEDLGRGGGTEEAGQAEPEEAGRTGNAGRAAEDGQAVHRLDRAVRAAEQALIEFEIAVETFRIEVENFSRLHHQRLGPMYARLDELDALIAEAVAARTGDQEDLRRARELRALVLPMPGVDELFHGWLGSDGLSPEATAMLTERPVQPPSRVRPGEEARRIYRELVRKAHPDLARDEAEKARRDAFIARVNEAYSAGDQEALAALAREWEAGPAPAAELPGRSEELYARLEWLAERKERLAAVAAELEESAIGAMLKMAPEDPDGLLEEIAEQLLTEVARREARLAQLVE